MGWTSGWGTLKSLIAERSKGWINPNGAGGMTVTSTCLAKCFRGNPAFAGTLWGVWEQAFTNADGSEARPPERFITCDLLRCSNYRGLPEWGYKDMAESCGPYYYNCPEKYLKMVPVVANQEWRDGVAEYHRERRRKRAAKKQPLPFTFPDVEVV
jgi:hypothetical protein